MRFKFIHHLDSRILVKGRECNITFERNKINISAHFNSDKYLRPYVFKIDSQSLLHYLIFY